LNRSLPETLFTESKMKAMILAAGKGTRVRPLTHVMPKPMIPLIRKPIMEAIVDHLRRHDFNEIYVNTSYLSQSIEDYFRDGDRFGVRMAFSYEGELVDGRFEDHPLGSAGGMRRIQDRCGFFDGTFAVLCGDALIDVDLGEVLRFHREQGAIATIVTKTVPWDEVNRYGVVVTDDSGRVQRFQEKPKREDAASNNINTGIYLFEPEIFEYIPKDREYDIGSQLFPQLIASGAKVSAISLPFQWVDIGCVKDFWTATRMLLRGEVQGFQLPGTEVAPGVHLGLGVHLADGLQCITGPVYIGSGTTVGPGARIEGPTVIGSNCIIESRALVREGILGDYTRVAADSFIDQRIVIAGRFVEPSGDSVDIQEADLGWLLGDARSTPTDAPQDELLSAMRDALPA
jgi:mannose-1-phosphate guanylyltransferase